MQHMLSNIIFDNTNCGLIVIDSAGTIIDVNQWFLTHSRCEKAQLIQKSVFASFTFSDEAIVKRSLEQATEYGMSSVLSGSLHSRLFPLYTRIRNSSEAMEQSCHIKSIAYEGNNYALFQIQNVTDAIKRELLLRHNKKELSIFSLAVKHSPSAVVITDSLGIIEYINTKYTEISDYQSYDCIGRPYFSLGLHAKNKEDEANIIRALEQGNEWTGERCNLSKSGKEYWVNEHIYPIFNNDKEVSHYIAIQDDVTQFRNISRKFSYQAAHDSLTGLINRQEFENILCSTIDGRIEYTTAHTLCFIDIDQFKIINETCGHVGGDELLRQMSQLFSEHCCNGEVVARLGGDEFALLLYGHDIEKAKQVSKALIQKVEDFRFRWDENLFKLGLSIGMTEINQHSKSYIEVIKEADNACYAAKDTGRNRYHIYQVDDQAVVQRKDDTYWATQINDALEQNRLTLYAQPIIPLKKYEKINYEVLVRMLDDTNNIIAPGVFLPVAERFNLSHRIDQWVIDNTLQWLSDNYDVIDHIDHISINLSGLSLSNEMLLQHIIKALKTSKVKASKITFEITETAAIANLTHAKLFISALSAYGCKFALDDFGSGLSSFAYLKNLKVDILKIDGMFVKDMLNDPIDEAMVKSINDVGHIMGMETIAEYVESEGIRDKLQDMGVNYGQGYGLGKPVPIDDIIKKHIKVI